MTTATRSGKDSGRITLIETIFFALYILLIAACFTWGRLRYGWRGAVGGLIFVLIVLPLVVSVLGYLAELIYLGRPWYPSCRSGNCRYGNRGHTGDYKFRGPNGDYEFRRLDNGKFGLFCSCGTRYRKRGRRFYEVQPDGSVRPYMVWRPFRGWFPESQ